MREWATEIVKGDIERLLKQRLQVWESQELSSSRKLRFVILHMVYALCGEISPSFFIHYLPGVLFRTLRQQTLIGGR